MIRDSKVAMQRGYCFSRVSLRLNSMSICEMLICNAMVSAMRSRASAYMSRHLERQRAGFNEGADHSNQIEFNEINGLPFRYYGCEL